MSTVQFSPFRQSYPAFAPVGRPVSFASAATSSAPKAAAATPGTSDATHHAASSSASGTTSWLGLIPQRLGDAVKRVVRMTFLRPTGLIELAFLHSWAGFASWVLPAKHAVEGLLHVDSLVIPRLPSLFGNLSQHRQYGRTLLDLFKGKPEYTPEASH